MFLEFSWKIQKLEKSLYDLLFSSCNVGLGSHYGEGQRVSFTGTSQRHLLGHRYAMYGAMFPLTKSPLYLHCLWVNFLMEKQAGLMSLMSLLPHRILFQPQGRLSYFYFLIKACVAISRSGPRAVSSAHFPFFWLCQGPAQPPFLLGGLPLHDLVWNLLAPIPALLTP